MLFPDKLTLNAIFIGKAAIHWDGRPASAIVKERCDRKQWVGTTGIRGDEQADLSVHGGPEKALHHYAADHYAFWKHEIPSSANRFVPGGFGENISTSGLTEEMLCIGDIVRIGEATVQVAQGRQPCWKLSAHVGRGDMAARFQKSGRTGWYYRVLQGGFIQPGDPVTLVERLHPDWPLSVVIAARFNPRLETIIARKLAMIAELSASWRDGFARKSDADYVEDTAPRLIGK